jgi:hypothetical protein
MATTFKKSIMTIPQLLVATLIVLAAGSCNDHGGEKGEWIPIPKDTSSLARIDHLIPVQTIDQYRKDYMVLRDTVARAIPNLFLPESEAFNKPQLLELLKNPKCVGIRIIYGLKPGKTNEMRCMIVGVDEQGQNLYIDRGSPAAAQTGNTGFGLEYGQCHPPCDGGR